MIYLTSDLHFNHNKEFVYKARGFECIEDMNKTIIENINNTVEEDATLYILGDICLGGSDEQKLTEAKEYITNIKCQNIYIIAGNHDTQKRIEMYKSCQNVKDVLVATTFTYAGYHFYLSHYPTFTANLEKESLKQCLINLYGHTHQKNNFYNEIPFMYHVGCDSHNCTPIDIVRIIEDCKHKVDECFSEI